MKHLFESFVDVGSGLLLATIIQLFVFPFFGFYPNVLDSFQIALVFTCISIFRSWFWRVVFNRKNKIN